MSQSQQTSSTGMQKDVIFEAFFDLEALVQEYRKAVLWLTHGNHEATSRPTVQETRDLMRDLKGKITDLLEVIEAKTQEPSQPVPIMSDQRK
jgi:hypothetical protein